MTIRGVWCAGTLGESLETGAFGNPEPNINAIYDLASLTKVLSTSALLVSTWIRDKKTWTEFLATPLAELLPELNSSPWKQLTLGACWHHESGLPGTRECFSPARRTVPMGESRALTWKPVLDQVLKEPLSNSSPQVLYSDLGFLLLGLWLERRWNQTLSEQFQNWKVARGLDANSGLTFGIPPQDPRYLLVEPTELRHAKGEVNDDKAASLGGIAPHAGLFGTLKDVTDWCEAVLRWSFEESKVAQWLSPGARIFDGGPRGRFYGGWDRPSPIPDSQGGFPCPERTLGHLGWTGTAFWWQPALKRVAVLLTNRVCPSHTAEGQAEMKKIRIAFFSDCWAGKLSSLWVPPL